MEWNKKNVAIRLNIPRKIPKPAFGITYNLDEEDQYQPFSFHILFSFLAFQYNLQ